MARYRSRDIRYMETEPRHTRFYTLRRSVHPVPLYAYRYGPHGVQGALQDDPLYRNSCCSRYNKYEKQARESAACFARPFLLPRGTIGCADITVQAFRPVTAAVMYFKTPWPEC